MRDLDWATLGGVIVTALVIRGVVRWKKGRRRHFRLTVVVERDYEGPDKPES